MTIVIYQRKHCLDQNPTIAFKSKSIYSKKELFEILEILMNEKVYGNGDYDIKIYTSDQLAEVEGRTKK